MMPTLHATPHPRAVLLEQLRAVGLTLRVPALAAAAFFALATLFSISGFIRGGDALDFHPELSMIPAMVGLALPMGVWMGETRFGAGFFQSLPVERRRHTLARVGAGWAWLMAAVALFVLWQLAFVLLSGGNVLAEETVRILPSLTDPARGALAPAALRTVRAAPEPLLWLVPFTAATGTYLLASAAALGLRHPLRWIVGTGLGLFLAFAVISEVGLATKADSLAFFPSRMLETLLYGPWGLDTLFTARTESLHTQVRLSTGQTVAVWRALPDVRQWAAATLLWTSAALLALWAAASRHRERRRA